MLVSVGEGWAARGRSDAFAEPGLGPNAFYAADAWTFSRGFTAFGNSLEICSGNLAFCCSIALSARSNSSVAVRAQEVVVVVGVVRVVVKLTMAEPAGVGL